MFLLLNIVYLKKNFVLISDASLEINSFSSQTLKTSSFILFLYSGIKVK